MTRLPRFRTMLPHQCCASGGGGVARYCSFLPLWTTRRSSSSLSSCLWWWLTRRQQQLQLQLNAPRSSSLGQQYVWGRPACRSSSTARSGPPVVVAPPLLPQPPHRSHNSIINNHQRGRSTTTTAASSSSSPDETTTTTTRLQNNNSVLMGSLLQSMVRETPPRNAAHALNLLQQWEKAVILGQGQHRRRTTNHNSIAEKEENDPRFRSFVKGLVDTLVRQQQQQPHEKKMWGVRQASIIVHLLGKMYHNNQQQQSPATSQRQRTILDATTHQRLLHWLSQSQTAAWLMGTENTANINSNHLPSRNLKPVHIRAMSHTLHALTRLWNHHIGGVATPHYYLLMQLHQHWDAFLAKATAHEVSLVLSSILVVLQQQQKQQQQQQQHPSTAVTAPISSWLGAIEQQADRLIQSAQEPCHVSNLLWACGTLLQQQQQQFTDAAVALQQQQPSPLDAMPHLVQAADRRAMELVQFGTPQEIANALWGCAKLLVLRAPGATTAAATTTNQLTLPVVGFSPHNLLTQVQLHAKRLVTTNPSNAQTVANTAWAVATLGQSSPQLFHCIDQHAPFLFFYRLGHRPHKDAAAVVDDVDDDEGRRRRITPQSIANTVWAFAELQHAAPNLMRQLQDEHFCAWFLEHGDPQHVASLVMASAKLQQQQQQPLDDGSNAGREHFSCTTLLDEVNRQAGWLVAHETTTPQHVANILWSFATVAVTQQSNNNKKDKIIVPHQFVQAVTRRAEWFCEHGDSQNVANFFWACAKLSSGGREDSGCGVVVLQRMMPALERHAARLVRTGTPQHVANILWACAVMMTTTTSLGDSQGGMMFPTNLLRATQDRAADLVREADRPQAIANLAWALATLGGHGGGGGNVAAAACAAAANGLLLELGRHRAAWFLETATPQEVANVVWACATLRVHSTTCCGPLFYQLDSHAERLFDSESEARSQALTNTAWGYATLNYRSPNVFGLLLRRQSWIVQEGGPLEVSNAALACALLGSSNQETPHLLLQSLGDCCAQLSTDDSKNMAERFLANACLALAIPGITPEYEPVLRQLWDAAMMRCSASTGVVNDRALVQLAQTQLLSSANGVHLPEPPPTVIDATELALQRLHPHVVSRSAREISQLLHEMGIEHDLEVSPVNAPSMSSSASSIYYKNNSLLSIDLATASPEGTKIAIEFDGPMHFLRDVMEDDHHNKAAIDPSITRIPNGTTQAKRRVLQKLGWTVISLDYRDYAEAKKEMRQHQWLSEQLRAAGMAII